MTIYSAHFWDQYSETGIPMTQRLPKALVNLSTPDHWGLFDIKKVLDLLNGDESTQWVVCCLASRKVYGFQGKGIVYKHKLTGEIKTYKGGGAYHGNLPAPSPISVDEEKSNLETASILIQECMHARDNEYPGFGPDPKNLLQTDEDRRKWWFRREIAGRIYEERWRLRNGHPPKTNMRGRPVYKNGARKQILAPVVGEDRFVQIWVVDEKIIKNYVKRIYAYLTDSNWEQQPTPYKKKPTLIPQKEFSDKCICKRNEPYSPNYTPTPLQR